MKLLTAYSIRKIRLKNRIVFPAIAIFDSYQDNLDERFKNYFLARARGGAGMLVMTGTRLSRIDVPINTAILQRCVESLKKFIEEIHKEGVAVGMQVHHGGRETDAPIPGFEMEPVGPSPIPSPVGKRIIPRALSREEIEDIIQRHVHINVFIKEAGFDFVEIKACHGYLFSSFLSPHTNKRKDMYGGSIEGRARIVTETIRRSKDCLGEDFVVGCRFNGSDYIKGGLTERDAPEIAMLLEKAGADYLSISAGVPGSYPTTIPTYYVKEGCFANLAAAVKKVVKVPVIAVGRITHPLLAEKILQEKMADLVAIGRGLLADPELPKKTKAGNIGDIRMCISCNQGCFDTPKGISPTCLVNPKLGKEKQLLITYTNKARRIMIVGGGPAGLEAARSASLRGHEVTLYEKRSKLGGQWRLAAVPPKKHHFLKLIDYYGRQFQKLCVRVRLNTCVTPDTIIRERPDVLIIATGAQFLLPDLKDDGSIRVIRAWDILECADELARRVLVIGGNSLGLEVANYLASKGSQVTVVEMSSFLGSNMGRTLRYYLKNQLKANPNVRLCKETKVEAVDQGRIIVSRKGSRERWADFDMVVLATGVRPDKRLAEKVKEMVSEVYIIGDAVKPRDCVTAINEGVRVGQFI